MAKAVAAMVSFAMVAASIIALQGFASEVAATEAGVLASQEIRLVQPGAVNCANEVWPNLPTACLQQASSTRKTVEARLVTARH